MRTETFQHTAQNSEHFDSKRQHNNFNFLTESDIDLLKNATPNLIDIFDTRIKADHPAIKTYIYLTTGSRLLSHFIRGVTENIYPKGIKRPEIRYVQCSSIADPKEDEFFRERLKDVINTCQPPFLIIDDYVTAKHHTFNKVKEVLRETNTPDEDAVFFAFIAEQEIYNQETDQTEPIPSSHYTELGIHFGILDPSGGSQGFKFNTNKLKGTQKNQHDKYEVAIRGTDRQHLNKVRRDLYNLGKFLTNTGN